MIFGHGIRYIVEVSESCEGKSLLGETFPNKVISDLNMLRIKTLSDIYINPNLVSSINCINGEYYFPLEQCKTKQVTIVCSCLFRTNSKGKLPINTFQIKTFVRSGHLKCQLHFMTSHHP